MNYKLTILTALVLSTACGTNPGDTPEQRLREENFRLRQENDSLKKAAAQNAADTIERDTIRESHPPVKDETPKIGGKHALTLQWISWEFPGSVTITPSNGIWHTITGSQIDRKNPENYVRISGRIKQLTARELSFEGTIETRIDHINGGAPCTRSGQKTFKATGSRKYWRLQDMSSCEGGTVDYIDIYFYPTNL